MTKTTTLEVDIPTGVYKDMLKEARDNGLKSRAEFCRSLIFNYFSGKNSC